MTSTRQHSLKEVAEKFDLSGSVTDVIRHKVGHINETYIVLTENKRGTERYILQKINDRVFCAPKLLMKNIKTVTEKVKRRVDERGGDIYWTTWNNLFSYFCIVGDDFVRETMGEKMVS